MDLPAARAEQIHAIVKEWTPASIGRGDFAALLTLTGRSVRSAINRSEQNDRPIMAMDWAFARFQAPQVSSISLGNLFRQIDPSSPRFLKDALSAGSAATGISFTAAGPFFAFFVAVMVLATRTVPRAEAMTLHLAWKVAKADGSFTIDDIMERAEELRVDYEVDKVGDTDVLSYLNNLARCGSLRQNTRGYTVVERIKIIDL